MLGNKDISVSLPISIGEKDGRSVIERGRITCHDAFLGSRVELAGLLQIDTGERISRFVRFFCVLPAYESPLLGVVHSQTLFSSAVGREQSLV